MKNYSILTMSGLMLLLALLVISGATLFETQNKQSAQPNVSASQIANTNDVFKVIKTDPAPDILKTYVPIVQIDFVFNDIVNPKTFYYEVSPKVDTYFKTQSNKLTLYTKNIWAPGITTITILSNTSGAHGGKLKQPFIYTFKTAIPMH